MNEPIITESLVSFIAANLHSVHGLETLLLLYADPTKVWTAQSTSQELRTSIKSSEEELLELSAKGLLRSTAADPVGFSYRAGDTKQDQTVAELEKAYKVYRLRVVEMIFSSPSKKLKTLSDAFLLRKDDPDE